MPFQDLKNAKSIVDWIAWAEPQYNFNPMIDEWCKEAPKELDFNHEAGIFRSSINFDVVGLYMCLILGLSSSFIYLDLSWAAMFLWLLFDVYQCFIRTPFN